MPLLITTDTTYDNSHASDIANGLLIKDNALFIIPSDLTINIGNTTFTADYLNSNSSYFSNINITGIALFLEDGGQLVIGRNTTIIIGGNVMIGDGINQSSITVYKNCTIKMKEYKWILCLIKSSFDVYGHPTQPVKITANDTSEYWAGIVILGDAEINCGTNSVASIQLKDDNDTISDLKFGGSDNGSDSGNFQFVIIEYCGNWHSNQTGNHGLANGVVTNGMPKTVLLLAGCGYFSDFDRVEISNVKTSAIIDSVTLWGGRPKLDMIVVNQEDVSSGSGYSISDNISDNNTLSICYGNLSKCGFWYTRGGGAFSASIYNHTDTSYITNIPITTPFIHNFSVVDADGGFDIRQGARGVYTHNLFFTKKSPAIRIGQTNMNDSYKYIKDSDISGSSSETLGLVDYKNLGNINSTVGTDRHHAYTYLYLNDSIWFNEGGNTSDTLSNYNITNFASNSSIKTLALLNWNNSLNVEVIRKMHASHYGLNALTTHLSGTHTIKSYTLIPVDMTENSNNGKKYLGAFNPYNYNKIYATKNWMYGWASDWVLKNNSSEIIPLIATKKSNNSDASIITDIVNDAPCFLEGTKILTPNGNILIETLNKGDEIIDGNGNIRIIKNISYKSVYSESATYPYKVPKGFLGAFEDLYITKDHGLKLDAYFVLPASLKLYQIPMDNLVYYHIQLDDYFNDTLVANGVITETWCGPPNELPDDFHYKLLKLNVMYKSRRIPNIEPTYDLLKLLIKNTYKIHKLTDKEKEMRKCL